MSYDNDQEDDDDQPQNITDEMEQKRLEEAAASVEWVFCWWRVGGEKNDLYIIPCLTLYTWCVCFFFIKFNVSPPRRFLLTCEVVTCVIDVTHIPITQKQNKLNNKQHRYRRARKAAIAAMEAEAAAE